MFDTQIAAGFVGYGTPSLVSLLQGEVGVSPPKGDRLTDWLRRPLSDDQMQYAAADVEYLLEVHDRLAAKLSRQRPDRLGRRRVRGTPHEAGQRRQPRRRVAPAQGRPHVAAECRGAWPESVAAWRERRAMRLDVPGAPGAARSRRSSGSPSVRPSTLKELTQARGVDDRHAAGSIAEEILVAVQRGQGGADRRRRRRRPTIWNAPCARRSR